MRALYQPISRLLFSGLACAFSMAVILSAGVARADTVTKPYFKAFGGDVFTGGAFNQGTGGDNCSTNYQYAGGGDPNAGGIFAFARDSGGKAAGGASSQHGAFALGDIQGNSSGFGFYSGGAQAGSVSRSYSTFANTSTTSWGGSFEGSVPQSSCIPDYYDLKKPSSTNALGGGGLPAQPASGSYSASGSPYHLDDAGAVNIKPGVDVTIYVDGSVYIKNNITYTLDSVDNVPKFALIVKGSIYIDNNVSELDGVYIAQPTTNDMSSDDGDIWTCHGTSSTQVLYNNPALIAPCASKLTVNGALIAKQVNFTRDNGNVTSANTSEDSLSGANSSDNIGEVINYSPSMIIGGPFFNPKTVTNFKVESLVSLPPAF